MTAARWRRRTPSAKPRPRDSPVLGERRQKRQEREAPEDHQRPGADGHGRPGLEHRSIGVALDQHMPEPQRPSEIHCQQQAAERHARKRDVVAQMCERAVLASPEQIDEHRHEVASTRQAADEEIHHDQPPPVWSGAEPCARWRTTHGRGSWSSFAPRLRKLKMPARPTARAPSAAYREAGIRLRVAIFGSGGNP